MSAGTTDKSTRSERVELSIVCPSWCVVEVEDHVADLWDMEGNCCHQSDAVAVTDTTGYQTALDEPRYYPAVVVALSTCARFSDGREVETPTIYLDQSPHSIQQALAIADELRRVVELYRSSS